MLNISPTESVANGLANATKVVKPGACKAGVNPLDVMKLGRLLAPDTQLEVFFIELAPLPNKGIVAETCVLLYLLS
jgi:hypothetical protein